MRDSVLQQIQDRLAVEDRRLLLRPLTGEEQLDLAFAVFRRMGWDLLKATAVPVFLVYAVLAYGCGFLLPDLFTTKDPSNTSTQVFEIVSIIAIGLFVALPLFLSAVAYATGIVSQFVVNDLVGQPIRPDEAVRRSGKALPQLVLAQSYSFGITALVAVGATALLLVSAYMSKDQENLWQSLTATVGFLGLGACLLLFPILVNRSALAPVVVIMENLKARAALKRGKTLLDASANQPSGLGPFGSFWSLAILLGLLMLIGCGMIFSLMDSKAVITETFHGSPLGTIITGMVSSLPGFLVIWTLLPAWCVLTSIIYVERRVRLEGLDIEVLARDAKTGRQIRA